MKVRLGGAVNPFSQRRISSGVGVRGHGVDPFDSGGDGNPLAVDLDALFAVDKSASARAGALITGEQDRVLRIGQRGLEMMQDTAAFGHAARRDDDAGRLGCGQLFRFLR